MDLFAVGVGLRQSAFRYRPHLAVGRFGARLSEIGSEGHLRMADFRPCPGGRRGHPFVQRVERGQPFGIRPDQNHVGRLVFVGGTLP